MGDSIIRVIDLITGSEYAAEVEEVVTDCAADKGCELVPDI